MSEVLREDDPRVADLLAAGWTVAHRSWGARLRSVDGPRLRALIRRVEASGYRVGELGSESDGAVAGLEAANRPDYPGGPTTAPAVRTAASLATDRESGTRWFGARRERELAAATSIRVEGGRGETGTTSVAAAHRRRDLAEAVKAASVLALSVEGVAVFGTGGADENAASLAMNARLGYEVTERWLTLEPPAR